MDDGFAHKTTRAKTINIIDQKVSIGGYPNKRLDWLFKMVVY